MNIYVWGKVQVAGGGGVVHRSATVAHMIQGQTQDLPASWEWALGAASQPGSPCLSLSMACTRSCGLLLSRQARPSLLPPLTQTSSARYWLLLHSAHPAAWPQVHHVAFLLSSCDKGSSRFHAGPFPACG